MIQFGDRPLEQLSDVDLERLIVHLDSYADIEGEAADADVAPAQRLR